MTQNLGAAQVELGVGTSGIDVGVAAAATKIKSLGKAGVEAGKEASAGIGKIGDAAGTAADKATAASARATASAVNAAKRALAEVSTFGQGAAARLEKQFELSGKVDLNQVKPWIAQLREAEKQAEAYARAHGKVGLSAKETAFALRGVPAQFTDIAVSLQGGQNPLTVFLQQGGQLKDMFGGIGPAAQALGGYILGLVNPLTVSAAAVGGLAYAWHHYNNVTVESAEITLKAIGEEYAARAALDGMTTASISNKIRLIKSEMAAQQAYASDMSHKITRFNWRDSAAQLTILNAAMAKNQMLLDQLEAQRPIAESESALKANLDANKQAAKDAAKAAEDAVKAAQKASEVSAKEVAASQAKIAVMNIEMDGTVKLTDSQKKLIDLGYEQTQSALKTTEAKYAENAARIAGVAVAELATVAAKDEIKAEEELNKQLAAGRKHYEDYWKEVTTSTEKLIEQAKQTEWETSLIGKSKDAIAAMTKERENETLAKAQSNLETMQTIGNALPAEIQLQEELIAALKRKQAAIEGKTSGAAAQAAIDAQTKAAEEQWKMIDGFAHTAFDNIFDKGNDTFKEIGNAIKKYVLNMLYEMGKKQFLISIGVTGGIGASGAAAAATNANDIGSMASGIQNLWNVGSSAVSSLFAPAATGMAAFTSAQMAGAVMSTAYTAPAIATLGAEAGAAASGLGALGSTIAAAMPWIAGGLAIYSLLSGNKSTPTTSLGHAVTSFSATGQQTGTQSLYGGTSAAVDAQIAAMQTGYMKAAMALGIGATSQQWGFAMNTGANGQRQMFGLSGGGFVQTETAFSDAEVQLAASRAVFAALQGSDLPEYLSRMFDGLTASTMTQQVIDNTLAFAGSVKQMRDALLETRTPLEVLRANVDSGTAAFATSAETFRTDFVAAIDAGVNPEVFEQWKALGTAIDQLAAADVESATQAAEAALQYQTTMLDLQGQISELNGNELMVTAVLIEQRKIAIAELNASDPTGYLAALTNQLWGLQDAAAAATTAAALAKANSGIQQQIDVITGTQTQRQIELSNAIDGADASTALLINQLFGLQDAAAIAAEAQAIAQENLSTAKSDLLEAYNRESSAAQQLAERMTGFADGFNRLRASLALGALSTLSPEAKYLEAKRQFEDVSRRAKLGDESALSELENVSQSFLQTSRDYNASSEIYARDFVSVNAALETSASVATRQANISMQQVSLLQSQLSALGLINDSVLSMADALAAFQVASAAVTPISAPISASSAAASSAATRADVSAYGQSYGGDAYYLIPGVNDYAAKLESATNLSRLIGMPVADVFELQGHSQEYWQEVQRQFDAGLHPTTTSVPGFAAGTNYFGGGLRIVGENGPELEATGPARIYNFEQTRQMLNGNDNAETNKLLKEVVIELRALVSQGGAVGSATLTKLNVVADKLDGQKRELARNGTNG